jgi:hypothetical protein
MASIRREAVENAAQDLARAMEKRDGAAQQRWMRVRQWWHILNRMEENLRNAIYWEKKYQDLNSKSCAAWQEMVQVMADEHGSAAQRTAIDVYKRHGLIASMRDAEDAQECQTPNLTLASVFEHFRIGTSRLSGQLKMRCPFPDHEDRTASFSVNFDRNVFSCQACGRNGGIYRFIAEYEGVSHAEARRIAESITGGAVPAVSSSRGGGRSHLPEMGAGSVRKLWRLFALDS